MCRWRWWFGSLVVVVVAGVLAVVAFAGPRTERGAPIDPPGPPGTGPLTVVGLGDSTMSGEGAGDYTPDTGGQNGDWCHRSPHASVFGVRVDGVTAARNLACSGAPAGQVALGEVKQWTEPSQAGQLRALTRTNRVSVVVVAVGANDDPKFSALVTDCVKAYFTGPACSDRVRGQWQARVDAMVPKVVAALRDVRSALADAGYTEADYQLVLQSYAAPLGPGIPEDLRTLNGCPFQVPDLRWVADEAVPTLARGLRGAAAQAGARFLDLSRAGTGHEACRGGADPASEWFTRLTLRLPDLSDQDRAGHAAQESFHPNAAGHAQFARCLSEFLPTPVADAACLAGPDGNLHPQPTVIAR